MRITTFFALSTLTLFACRSDSNNTTDGNGGGDGSGSNAGAVKIKDVQNDAMAPGTQVELHGVIVTAIDKYGSKVGDFWVEDADGGPYSGIHIFGAQTGDVAGLHLGDSVDISGAVKSEFALTSDTTGRTVTELEPVEGGQITITNNGPGTVPDPQMVDALMIGQLAETSPPSATSPRSMEWEKWEGVLITVTNVTATNNPKCVGSACSDMTLENFGITGDAVVESSLAAFPNDGGTPPHDLIARGDCLGGVTGVVDYFFDYLILPRQTSEIMTGGTACPVENSAALCGDGMDNDGNGFADCEDNACIVGDDACRTTTTVSAVQTATPTGPVELHNVYVTKISKNKKNMWVQTNLTSAGNDGIYVFGNGDDYNFPIGSQVDVIGTVTEYNNDMMGSTLTELNALSVTAGTVTTAAPVVPVTNQTVANLMQAGTGEPYESVEVTLTNVKITALGTSSNHGVGTLVQNGVTFQSDDDIYLLGTTGDGAAVNTCYASITGIWTYLVFNDAYGFLPFAVGTGTGTCN